MKSGFFSWLRKSSPSESGGPAEEAPQGGLEEGGQAPPRPATVTTSADRPQADPTSVSIDFESDSDAATPAAAERPTSAEVGLPALDNRALARYDDAGEIGRGGMGRVHRVLDQTLLREVALKVLRPELENQRRQVQRFVREAQITAQLDHPNIVPIHEIGRDPETGFYISMKLVDGETLTQAIENAGPARLEPDRLAELLQVFIKVCDAIAFAHSRGVIHRDLKPSNIMVGKFGQVYVMDWGVARLQTKAATDSRSAQVASELLEALEEKQGNIIGTPRYMPPEQIQGKHDEVDERSDIFALGATLYHILTGQPPYTAKSYYNTLLEALSGKMKSPEEVVGDTVPTGLAKIAMRALAFRKDERYASVTELQKDVERFLRGSWDQVIQAFGPGARIVTEGDEGDVAYIILEGRCSVFTEVGGEKVKLREMGPGEVFGETAVFTSSARTASVEALDDVKVKVVSRETLTHGLGLNSWMGTFVTALADLFRDVDERLRKAELAARPRGGRVEP